MLVHGAAGGIGTAAIQLGRGHGRPGDRRGLVRGQGGDRPRCRCARRRARRRASSTPSRELTSGRGVDVVVDPVGGDRFTDYLRSLAPGGRLLVIGFTAGSIPEVRVNRLLLSNISVVGVGWGAWWTGRGGPGPAYLRSQWDDLAPLLESGAVDPAIGEARTARRRRAALTAVDERRATGKMLLMP